MDDSADEADITSSNELNPGTRESLLNNEMRSFKNRGFHDGYDDGKRSSIQEAFDSGYQKAFEQNFVLSTLKGVAQALKSSYNLNQNQNDSAINSRPTSTISTTSTTSTASSSSSTSPSKNPKYSSRSRMKNLFGSSSKISCSNKKVDDLICSSNSSSASSITASNLSVSSVGNNMLTPAGSSKIINKTAGSASKIKSNNINNNHLLILESMKFDNVQDIESIKSDLIKICRENRLEILAHYISQIG